MWKGLKDLVAGFFLSDYVGSVVRTGLAGVAGFLLGSNIVDSSLAEQFIDVNTEVIGSLLVYLVAQYSSLKNKKFK